jgi:hypothetical protein
MSYRLTETGRKYISVIEDLVFKIEKDPIEQSQLLLVYNDKDKLDLKIKLPKYKLSYDHDTNSLRLIDEMYSSIDINETVEWGWKYTIKGIYNGDYLESIQIIRLNDGEVETLNVSKLSDVTLKSLQVDGLSEFLSSVLIEGLLQVKGDTNFENNVTVDKLLKTDELVSETGKIKDLSFYDNKWIDVKISSNDKLGLVEGIEEEGCETFGKISIDNGKCKVNNLFFEFSEEFDDGKEGLHFIIEEDNY